MEKYKLNKKAIKVPPLGENDEKDYWRSRTAADRLKAVEINRSIVYGYAHTPPRFQRFFEVAQLEKMKQFILLAMVIAFPFALSAEDMIDRTTGRSGVCELHKVQMHKVKVPIAYGLPLPWSEEERRYFDVKEKLFPNANDGKVEGGCIPSPQKEANIYVCPRCEKEREDWLKADRSQNQATQQGAVAEDYAAELPR